jgi:hypothetical protein
MKKGASFAGPTANQNIAEFGAVSVAPKFAAEHPAVFGGSSTHLPEGTEVELPESGGYRVVAKPSK